MARRWTRNPCFLIWQLAVASVVLCGCAPLSRLSSDTPVPRAAAESATARPASSPSAATAFAIEFVPTSPPATDLAKFGSDPSPTETGSNPSSARGPTSTPPEPAFKLRGRIEAEAVTVSQSPKDKALYGDFQNAVGFRRARLGAEGNTGEQVHWVAEFDFAGGNVAFKNVFAAVRGLPVVGEVRVGHFLEPFSLEGQMPSTIFPLTERSPGAALDPGRNWGVGVFSHTADERITFQAGAFRSGTDNTGTDTGDGNDLAMTGRVTGLPWYEASRDSVSLLHVGGAASQRSAKNDTVTFPHGPQSSLLQSGTDNPLLPFATDPMLHASQSQLFNLQSALVLGSLSVQAEWIGMRVDQIGGGPVFFQGAYIMAGYFLTGEQRTYDRAYGTFGGPKVASPFVCADGPGRLGAGPGAWELVARLAWLDFSDPNLPPTASGLPAGGRLTTVTLGINWYLSNNARLMLDYVHAVPTNLNAGSSTADSVTIRTAVFW